MLNEKEIAYALKLRSFASLRMGIMLKRYCSFTSDKEAGTNENRLTDEVARDLGVGGTGVSAWRNNLLRRLSI